MNYYPRNFKPVLRRQLEPELTAAVRVMNDSFRAALCQRHVESAQYELRLQVIRHRPADDPPRPHIEHDGEIQEAL